MPAMTVKLVRTARAAFGNGSCEKRCGISPQDPEGSSYAKRVPGLRDPPSSGRNSRQFPSVQVGLVFNMNFQNFPMKPVPVTTLLILAASCFALVSCGDQDARMGKGFRLPEGDQKRGSTAFTELKCHRCHTVEGVTLPDPQDQSGVQFSLGGEVRVVKTYGQLVTAIIQPQHVVSPEYLATLKKEERESAVSPMANYNDIMTVRQLTDLVTFLHTHYQEAVPEYNEYELPY